MRSTAHTLALFALGILLGACSGQPSGPSLLLVTVDTLRADRLGCYGYERDTTPCLDRLAAEGVRFERAYSHAPFTAPAHASLMTSLHTQSHGVLAWEEVLSSDARTLGQRFSAAGYRTAAIYNHPGLRQSDVTRGFEHVRLLWFEDVDTTVDAFLDWLGADEQPFAAWLHLWDVHRPYGFRDWRPEWLRDEVEREELTLAYGEGEFGDPWNPLVGRHEGFYNQSPERRARPVAIGAEQRTLGEADFRYLSDRYDGGVRFADRGLGRLFDALRERGVLERTLVVVTSDHGESFTEREPCYFTHDPFLYEETLRVPLLLRFPRARYAGSVVSSMARGIDVLPTLLEACDLPADARDQGRSLMPLVEGRSLRPVPLFAQTQSRSAKERSAKVRDTWVEERLVVSDGRHKLIHDREHESWSFFDLESDPREERDLYADALRLVDVERLRSVYYQLLNGLPRASEHTGELDASMRELLEDIGY